MEQQILEYLKKHEEEIFEDLKTLVRAEASTSDVDALTLCRKVLERLVIDRTGIKPQVHKTAGGHDPIQFAFGTGEETVVLVGHYDTVHPIGSLKLTVDGNKMCGPGVYDMKSGLVSAIWCIKAYKDLGIDPGKRLVCVFNGDEETGSAESTDIICDAARNAKAALVMEPCTANGDLKTGRKGTMKLSVTIHGKAAHAGNAHHLGANAIEEMAHEILFVQSLTDYDAGTTVNVGVVNGGTKVNVVPDVAEYHVDCRFCTVAERNRVKDAVLGMETKVAGTTREVTVKEGKMPMEQTEGNMALFAIAKACGEKVGLEFSHQFVGGGSDGNAISAMGIPTLDGLGAAGDHAHSPEEYILIDQYLPRMAMLAALIVRI